MSQILNVVVVGFHHKKGCQVDFSYPPLIGDGENGLPEEWMQLPSLALPDGAHNTQQDVIYFTLPSIEEPGRTIFGISCFRQISAKELLSKSEDVTRSTVQKSVCVLSRYPLYGVLKAKLQLITQAYFNERDFTKVEVLSQMYTNLCEMFEGDLVDGQAAIMDISVQELFRIFKHRVLIMFKLLLLERRVVFNISPVQLLGDTMISLISLFPNLLESGLFYSSFISMDNKEEPSDQSGQEDETCGDFEKSRKLEEEEDKLEKDSFGFPLSIFTCGNVFYPYLSISFLDSIRSSSIRGFTIGATNALFVTKKELLDAIVTVDEYDNGQVEIINQELKKTLQLTTADLRFGDYIMKNIEVHKEYQTVFEGGDEWIRLQLRGYLLGLASSARADLQVAVADYGTPFITAWKNTRNYRVWMRGNHEDLVGAVPGHAFSGQIGMYDVLLRMEQSVSQSDGARKAINVLSTTGKSIGETGNKVKQSIGGWLKNNVVWTAEEATEVESSGNEDKDSNSTDSRNDAKQATSSGLGADLSNKVKNLTWWLKGTKSADSQEGVNKIEAAPSQPN